MADVEAYELGVRLARDAIAEHERRQLGRPARAKGLVVAEGDSWFSYGLEHDVLDELRELGWEVRSTSFPGDTLENIAYDQALQTVDLLADLARQDPARPPTAVLLSGGGNDLAGPQFALLLEHALSGRDPVNSVILDEVVDRLRTATLAWIARVTVTCRHYFETTVPILVHGYAYPFPDGRGWWTGLGLLPGPWLRPAFEQKRLPRGGGDRDEVLERRAALMVVVLDRFNEMLAALPATPGLEHVRYVDVRTALVADDYRDMWDNELHPSRAGFRRVARAFDTRL